MIGRLVLLAAVFILGWSVADLNSARDLATEQLAFRRACLLRTF